MKVGNGKFHSPRKLPVSFIITPKITPGLQFFSLYVCVTVWNYVNWVARLNIFLNFFLQRCNISKTVKTIDFHVAFQSICRFYLLIFLRKNFRFHYTKTHTPNHFSLWKGRERSKMIVMKLDWTLWMEIVFLSFWFACFLQLLSLWNVIFSFKYEAATYNKQKLDNIKWNRNNKKSRIHL